MIRKKSVVIFTVVFLLLSSFSFAATTSCDSDEDCGAYTCAITEWYSVCNSNCVNDNVCVDGYACSPEGACELQGVVDAKEEDATSCSSDSDCSDGFGCGDTGFCLDSCDDYTDCKYNSICESSSCVEIASCSDTESTVTDLISSVDITVSGTVTGYNTNGEEVVVSDACYGNTLYDSYCNGVVATTLIDCIDSGLVCSAGACMDIASITCTANSDCPSSYVCDTGSCVMYCVEGVVACSDGVDNDGDEKVDYDGGDVECRSPLDTDESADPQCADGIDNDGDNNIDYPADTTCKSPEQSSEELFATSSAPEIEENFFAKLWNFLAFWN